MDLLDLLNAAELVERRAGYLSRPRHVRKLARRLAEAAARGDFQGARNRGLVLLAYLTALLDFGLTEPREDADVNAWCKMLRAQIGTVGAKGKT